MGEAVRLAAEADFTAKDKALEAAKALQASEVAAGQKLSAEEISNALSAFDSETASYDTLRKSQTALLDREDALLESIKAALQGNGFSLKGKTEHAAIDTCANELGPLKTAKAALVKASTECASFEALAAVVQLPRLLPTRRLHVKHSQELRQMPRWQLRTTISASASLLHSSLSTLRWRSCIPSTSTPPTTTRLPRLSSMPSSRRLQPHLRPRGGSWLISMTLMCNHPRTSATPRSPGLRRCS